MAKPEIPFAKRSFGQNFLSDKNYIDKIINATDLSADDVIVEIGPGRGALTERLVESAGRVIAIELDRDMAAPLSKRFSNSGNFELILADALKVDFQELSRQAGKELKLVANLPYYISTAILQHLIQYRHSFTRMILMFQREVVDRILAVPGTAERGYLTVLVEAFFGTRRLFDVPPKAFRPAPKVWSSVILIIPHRDEPNFDPGKFKNLISAAFRQKRKTLQNNLRASAYDLELNDERIAALLDACKIEPARRAETLTRGEWACLAQKLG